MKIFIIVILFFTYLNFWHLFNEAKKLVFPKYIVDIEKNNNLLIEFKRMIESFKIEQQDENFFELFDNYISNKNLKPENIKMLFEFFFSLNLKYSTEMQKFLGIKFTQKIIDIDILENKPYYFLMNLNEIKNGEQSFIYYPKWKSDELYSNFERIFEKEKIFNNKKKQNLFYQKYLKYELNLNSETKLKNKFIYDEIDINEHNPYFLYNFIPELYINKNYDFDQFKYIIKNKFDYNFNKLKLKRKNEYFKNYFCIYDKENEFFLGNYLSFKISYIYFNLIDYLELIYFRIKNRHKNNYILYNFGPKNIYFAKKEFTNYFKNVNKNFNLYIDKTNNFEIVYKNQIHSKENLIIMFNNYFNNDLQLEIYKIYYLYYFANKSDLKEEFNGIINKMEFPLKNNKLECEDKHFCIMYSKIIQTYSIINNQNNSETIKIIENSFNMLIFKIIKIFNNNYNESLFNLNNTTNLKELKEIFETDRNLISNDYFDLYSNFNLLNNFSFLIIEESINRYSRKIDKNLYKFFEKIKNNIYLTMFSIKKIFKNDNLSIKNYNLFIFIYNTVFNSIYFSFRIKLFILNIFGFKNINLIAKEITNFFMNNNKNFIEETYLDIYFNFYDYIKNYMLNNKNMNIEEFKEKLINHNLMFNNKDQKIQEILIKDIDHNDILNNLRD